MIPTVVRVFLSDQSTSAVEVPITPNTTAKDVIDCCKEPGELYCHLSEVWRGKERAVSENEKPYTILQQWGSHSAEVQFYLRHDNGSGEKQPEWATGDYSNKSYIAKDGRIMTPNGGDMTLNELKEIALKQQQQIELQHKTLVSKEQRLRFLKQQMQQQQAVLSENEKLRRLREKAEAQEAKLQKIRALQGKVDQQRYENTTMSSELDAVRLLFEEKHIELSAVMFKVQELTKQLDELQKGKLLNSNFTIGSATSQNGGDSSELDKLKREMGILNRMNEDQQKRLDEQRSVLKRRNEDATELDRRIEELTNRLRQKKLASSQASAVATPSSRMHTIVAAVEPLVKKAEPNLKVPLKPGHTLPPVSAGHGIIGRIDQAPATELPRGQPEGINLHNQATYNRNLPSWNKSDSSNPLPPGKAPLLRPQSALAQFPPESRSFVKPDPATAKVRPMVATPSEMPGYYYPKPTGTPSNSSGGVNIFAYKPPPVHQQPDQLGFSRSSVTVLPSGNIKYTQALNPPPPYPGSAYVTTDQSGRMFEPRITVDFESLRRKFANAPRPLKKRSSITEPERPQGPVISKLLYDQLYKRADTPFCHLPSEHRSTPPPAYIEPPKPVDSPLRQNEAAVPDEKDEISAEKEPESIPSEDDDLDDDDGDEVESESDDSLPPPPIFSLSAAPTKGILKAKDAVPKDAKRRIRFDPLALLLDASLEGEFELVKEIIDDVPDPSGANDEGITPLHNAVCAGHYDLVKFMVHYGIDVNAPDADGWTPLHCAASCNNLALCRLLVESGACLFASIYRDGETAADKCEEFDEGYLQCSDFLYSTQDKLGLVRQGQVYALYDYDASNDDELSFHDGDLLTVIRKGDDNEEQWWWARLGEKEGYIPRNLLGMWPRIKPSRAEVQT